VREEATAVIREEAEGTATATAVAHEEHLVEDGAVERTLARLLEGCRARAYELLARADLTKPATSIILDKDVGFWRGVVVKLAQVQQLLQLFFCFIGDDVALPAHDADTALQGFWIAGGEQWKLEP